jgi:hypothetical protein
MIWDVVRTHFFLVDNYLSGDFGGGWYNLGKNRI